MMAEGGAAPDRPSWDHGGKTTDRELLIWVDVDLAFFPGPPGFLNSSCV